MNKAIENWKYFADHHSWCPSCGRARKNKKGQILFDDLCASGQTLIEHYWDAAEDERKKAH